MDRIAILKYVLVGLLSAFVAFTITRWVYNVECEICPDPVEPSEKVVTEIVEIKAPIIKIVSEMDDINIVSIADGAKLLGMYQEVFPMCEMRTTNEAPVIIKFKPLKPIKLLKK